MEILKANCPGCGAPLTIPDDRNMIYCSSCGSSLAIDRSESSVTLKFAEKIVSAIEQSGDATQNAIRENAYVTRTELQRLQASQELSSSQLQLSNLQAEIRTVERSPISAAATAQKLKLHQSEYELLDRMYDIHKRISTPDPVDLQACINFANWEISWLHAEISALSFSGQGNRVQLIKSLNIRINELTSQIAGLKILQLRNRFISYKQPDPSQSDSAAISALLSLLVADEQNARAFRSSPEGIYVYNEIVTRQQKLKSWLVQGDRKQLGEIIVSNKYQAKPDNLDSLHELMVLIDLDLRNDFSKFDPGVTQEFKSALLTRKNKTQQQITKLEYRLQNGRDPGLLPWLFAAIAAGLTALFGSKSNTPTLAKASPPSIQDEKVLVTNDRSGQGASLTTLELVAEPQNIPPTFNADRVVINQPLKAQDFVSIGLGCLSGLVITVIISIIGLFVFSLVNGTKTATGSTMFIFFLFVTIGFGLGAFVFLLITAPRMSFRGFGPFPRIYFTPIRSGKGIQNSKVIKLFFGLITCINIYLIFFALSSLSTELSTGLGAILLLIGLVSGPILAILAAKRASIS